jgi:Protein of Unknown function (DUF2784)
MTYGWLADLVVVVHAAFVVFAVTGGLLVLWRPWIAWLHLPAAAWAALIEFSGWVCPLTPLENALRERAGEAAYRGGFIQHYLLRALYPSGLTRPIQWLLGCLVLVVNIAAYVAVMRRHRRRTTTGPVR